MIFTQQKKKNSIIIIIIVSKGFWTKGSHFNVGIGECSVLLFKTIFMLLRHANMTQPKAVSTVKGHHNEGQPIEVTTMVKSESEISIRLYFSLNDQIHTLLFALTLSPKIRLFLLLFWGVRYP